ncbi:aminoglycoside adenylyltransferase domain-containing protein [Bdellovibrio bacteriovorus]|uniref:aminoglycoside adenylyltransferase domain-containing protein n=1 Tax=Bdellovibrio bacteriovorus TaxID=959 RepID=UPI0035A633B7
MAIARIWFTALTGTITSKDKAAEWLIPQVPIHHAKLLTEARNGYLGIAPDRLAEKHQELLNFVTYAQSKLEKNSKRRYGEAALIYIADQYESMSLKTSNVDILKLFPSKSSE